METVDLYGVRRQDGLQVNLGKVPMSPTMKARDIIENYIGRNYHDEDSEENTALMICEDLVSWMKSQGWTPPPMKVEPVPAKTSLDECIDSGQVSAAQIEQHREHGEI